MAYDLNDFVPNFDLYTARTAFNQTSKTLEGRHQFFSQIKQARFLVPQRQQENGTIGIATLCNKKQQSFIPAFTDAGQYQKWIVPADEPAPISYEKLKRMVIHSSKKLDGIVINPFDHGMFLRLEQIYEIDTVVDGYHLEASPRNGQIHFYPPFNPPYSFIKTMIELFDSESCVYSAWLMLSQAENEVMPKLTILADFDGERPDLSKKLAHVLLPFLKPGDHFEFVKADYVLIQIANQTVKPFYTKDA